MNLQALALFLSHSGNTCCQHKLCRDLYEAVGHLCPQAHGLIDSGAANRKEDLPAADTLVTSCTYPTAYCSHCLYFPLWCPLYAFHHWGLCLLCM